MTVIWRSSYFTAPQTVRAVKQDYGNDAVTLFDNDDNNDDIYRTKKPQRILYLKTIDNKKNHWMIYLYDIVIYIVLFIISNTKITG